MVSRGERELRGERRGKGGRSLLATAAPFFFVLAMPAGDVAAQRVEVYARGGAAGSTALVRDEIATAQLAALLGAVVFEEVEAVPKLAPVLGGGVRVGFWPRVSLVVDGEWTSTELEARDAAGTRPIQDMSVVQAVVGAAWSVRPAIELGAGAGLVWYLVDETGLFAGGVDTSPLLELSAAWTPSVWKGRLALVGAARTHRLGTPVISQAGGQDGNVTRYAITARVRLFEVSR